MELSANYHKWRVSRVSVSFNYTNKKVIVTGAAGKIGSWICEAFHRAGADLWMIDVNEGELLTFAETLRGNNQVRTSSFDLTEEDKICTFFKKIQNEWGYADILINNAGLYPNGKMLDIKLDLWDQVMDLNVRVPFIMTKSFSNLLIQAKQPGSIINLISKSAKTPRIGAVHYAMSKASLEMMTRGLGMELAEHNIRVNAVSPGFAPGSKINALSDEYIEAMNKKIPLGRTTGPNDAPQAILFLCSEAADFITGSSVYVDGGNSAGDFNIPVIDSL